MKLPLIVFLLLIGIGASYADEKSAMKMRWEAERARINYIRSTRPKRIDEPLREENVSDVEIEEIQAATSDVFPGAIANISGVVSECPCEDGPTCDSQVWVLAYKDGRYDGLLLSRIDKRWQLGPVQIWWNEYELLRRQLWSVGYPRESRDRSTYQSYVEKMTRHRESFPMCSSD